MVSCWFFSCFFSRMQRMPIFIHRKFDVSFFFKWKVANTSLFIYLYIVCLFAFFYVQICGQIRKFSSVRFHSVLVELNEFSHFKNLLVAFFLYVFVRPPAWFTCSCRMISVQFLIRWYFGCWRLCLHRFRRHCHCTQASVQCNYHRPKLPMWLFGAVDVIELHPLIIYYI